MKKYITIMAIAAVIGLTSGLAYADQTQTASYCEKVEQQVKDRGKINGTLACVDPENTDMNISEEASAELRCSCMIVQNGSIQFVNVGSA